MGERQQMRHTQEILNDLWIAIHKASKQLPANQVYSEKSVMEYVEELAKHSQEMGKAI